MIIRIYYNNMEDNTIREKGMQQPSIFFNNFLSLQTAEYVKSKKSVPVSPQQLQNLDLHQMCAIVEKQIQSVEGYTSQDYLAVRDQLRILGDELFVADSIMEELQHVLFDFKGNLQAIKGDMNLLQQKSIQMNTSLGNKKKVHELLTSFIESAVLDSEVKEVITSANIDETYTKNIQVLLKKFNYLNSNLITPDTKAIKELQPQLEKLKAKASVRLREFLLEQIHSLKKSKSVIQNIQKNVLGKYKVFTQFFKEQNTQIYTQICNSYRQTMAKIYLSNYKIYLSQIQKLQLQLYKGADQLIPLESKDLRLILSQLRHIPSLSQQKKSIFSLMNRDQIINSNSIDDIIKYNVAAEGGYKFTIQRTFKSVNKCLVNEVIHEIIFTAQFFSLHSQGATQIFAPIFRPSLDLFLQFLKKSVAHTHDIYSVLIILAINQQNKKTLTELGCSALDHYFSQVSIILWPKFQELFQYHLQAIKNCSVSHFKKLEKHSGKSLIDRFVDFLVGLYRLYFYFQSSTIMFQKRLEALRRQFFGLVGKVYQQNEKENEKLTYYVDILQQVHNACTSDPIVANFKGFHSYQLQLQKQIEKYSFTIINLYIKEFFPNLHSFIIKYCNQNEEGSLLIQGNVQTKSLELILGEVSPQSISSWLIKIFQFCEKSHSGYCLRLMARKMTSVFTRYYSDIYKYCKSSYPQLASTMLQVHTVIKQIKIVFNKYS